MTGKPMSMRKAGGQLCLRRIVSEADEGQWHRFWEEQGAFGDGTDGSMPSRGINTMCPYSLINPKSTSSVLMT